MTPRILSIATPLFIYVTLVLLFHGIWKVRRSFDFLALAPAALGLVASLYFLEPIHRLFFDEDIYLNIAGNLARAPVAQLTLFGSPTEIAVSTYYKEPAGWPATLALAMLAGGSREGAAFLTARIIYALTIIAVYTLAMKAGGDRFRALAAAIAFAAAPVCFWFSASPGTDMAAALFSTLGLVGLVAGNGAIAAPALAMAAQVRLEMIVLLPLVWLNPRISRQWKAIVVALTSAQLVHILWVLSVAPVLEAAEGVESAFGIEHVLPNLRANILFALNPVLFPSLIGVAAMAYAIATLWRGRSNAAKTSMTTGSPAPSGIHPAMILHPLLLISVYLFFYAGAFQLNPRYSIQLLPALAALAAAFRNRLAVALLTASVFAAHLQPYQEGAYIQTLAEDHRISQDFAARLSADDLMVSMEHEMFINHGARALSAVLASERPEKLDAELEGRRKVYYHEGARTNVQGTQAWAADQWMKSNYELHLIDSREIRGMRISFYEVYRRTSIGKLESDAPSTARDTAANWADVDSKERNP